EHLVAGDSGACPRVIVSTHLVEVFDVLRPGTVRTAEMQVDFDERDAVPLFRLRENAVAQSSYGAACARRAGVPEHVVRRAEEVLALTAKFGAQAALRSVAHQDSAAVARVVDAF